MTQATIEITATGSLTADELGAVFDDQRPFSTGSWCSTPRRRTCASMKSR